MPGNGAIALFSLGQSYGAILGVGAALGLRVELVAPQTWKSSVLKGTKKDKDAAIAYCRIAFPDVSLVLPRCRKPHDGMADAVYLAEYGFRAYMLKTAYSAIHTFLSVTEPNQSSLISQSAGLPFSIELFTSKLLDVLLVLMNRPRSDRSKLNQMLYSRTRPGLILDLKSNVLRLAYMGQPGGHGTQHKWRLYFTEALKDTVEKAAAGSALVVTGQRSDDGNEWGGTVFRSQAEKQIAEALYKRGVLFFVNCVGRVSDQGSPISATQTNGRIEVDFLVCVKGKPMILEVDGQHHREEQQTIRDYVRDRLMLREGIPTARFTGQECLNSPDKVVEEFLNMFPT